MLLCQLKSSLKQVPLHEGPLCINEDERLLRTAGLLVESSAEELLFLLLIMLRTSICFLFPKGEQIHR